MICSVISNVEIVSFRIISGHHLTGGAVGVIQADIFRERFANRNIDSATCDTVWTVASWDDTVFQLDNGDIPVVSPACVRARELIEET